MPRPTRPEWLPEGMHFEVNDWGMIVPTLRNVVAFLCWHPEWRGRITYDEFTHRIIIKGRVPVRRAASGTSAAWSDGDDLEARLWLASQMREPRSDTVREAVRVAAQRNPFNAVTEYLDRARLSWDGVARIGQWAQTYLGACSGPEFEALGHEQQRRLVRYTGRAAAMWLISAAKRAFRPGTRVDHMLILEGRQGIRKSTALRVLGSEFFSDATLDLCSKDTRLLLSRFWIIEMAELESLSRARIAQIKAFLTQHVDHYRPPYGAAIREQPRHCVFAGTVNHREYLRDPTGNRRIWPIAVGPIDLERLTRDRDLLWGEACALALIGQRHWPDETEVPLFEEQQASRLRQHGWTGPIVAYLEGHIDGEVRQTVTAIELLDHALQLERSAWPGDAEEQVGKIMSQLGWERKRSSQPPRGRYYERG